MFDRKYYTTKVVNDYSEVSSQMRLDRESREKIAEREIRARDRVDISRDEYESMKDEIKRLQSELCCANYKLENFGVAANLNIVPNTTNVFFSESFSFREPESELKCMITFRFIPEEGRRLRDYLELE